VQYAPFRVPTRCLPASKCYNVSVTGTPQTTNELAVGMRSVIGRLARGLRQAGSQSDLSPSQYEVFGTIARRGDLKLSELAAIEGINPTLLSRIVAKLEADQLVTRTPDPDDRRVAHVVPTARGRRRYEQIKNARTDALGLAINGLTDAERHALVAALPVLESLAGRLRDGRA
jgi:DNA-binding MarR family transcriptional regulator